MHLSGDVLITGVSGFIGSHLAERLLREGVRVRGLDIARRDGGPRVEFFHGDVTDPESLRAPVRGCPVVFHCARWNGQPRTWDAPMPLTSPARRTLLEACLQVGVTRVVHLSSIVVYGPTHRAMITEDTPLWPVDVYGTSKVGAERRVEHAIRKGLRVVTLRSGQAYGPRAPGGTSPPSAGCRPGVPSWSTGAQGSRTRFTSLT